MAFNLLFKSNLNKIDARAFHEATQSDQALYSRLVPKKVR